MKIDLSNKIHRDIICLTISVPLIVIGLFWGLSCLLDAFPSLLNSQFISSPTSNPLVP